MELMEDTNGIQQGDTQVRTLSSLACMSLFRTKGYLCFILNNTLKLGEIASGSPLLHRSFTGIL